MTTFPGRRAAPADSSLDDPAEARIALLEREGMLMDSGVPEALAIEEAAAWYRRRYRRTPPRIDRCAMKS